MIQATLVKRRRRRASGKIQSSRFWSIKWKVPSETRWKLKGLKVTLREVAEQKLIEFRREKEMELGGVVPPRAVREAAGKPMTQHLAEFVAEQLPGRAKAYVIHFERHVKRLIEECGWSLPKDVTADSFLSWRSEQELSAKTLNDYLAEGSAVLRWMVKRGRMASNPLAVVDALPCGAGDPKRRALADDEVTRLLAVAGPRRVVYLLALTTGLRRKELKLLQWGDVHLEAPHPFINARPSTTKNGKTAVLWLRDDVVDELRKIKPKDVLPVEAVFAKGPPDMPAYLADLAAAEVDEYDSRGRRADFHALRHTVATNLNRAGVAPRVAQEVMRHSELSLTMRTYTDAGALPTLDAVNSLPRWPVVQQLPKAAKATGTDGGKTVVQNGTHENVRKGHSLSSRVQMPTCVEVQNRPENPGESPRLSAHVTSGGEMHHVGLEPTTR